VWRKHLDFAAIRDIHSIKRQINAHWGFGTIRVLGHDPKVGRGGIREIEFFVQTQQLILGGRSPELREPPTIRALEVLAGQGWIESRAAEDLTRCYRRLRALEHRLQMVQDRQTQALPRLDSELARFAAFAGLASAEALGELVLETLRTVEQHYAELFEAEVELGVGGNLVFTGTSDDPNTLETLTSLGFKDPSAISARIRAWHHGHVRATRSTRARELLTELTPSILDALHRQPDIDAAFRLFDEFVSGLPAGVQLFSLFRANPRLLALVADLMGAAPRLARHLAGNVDLFEAMLQPDFFGPLPERPVLEAELGSRLGDARDLQDVLDLCRHWAHGRQFQAGLQVLLGLAPAESAATTLTGIAEIVIGALLPRARAWLETQHGSITGGAFVVLGLGKLGSTELTTSSDLDLVFVYDAPEGAVSSGEHSLAAPAWFARLGQRLVSAITARTPEGRLFEIDTRLRPSGNMGPVATSLDSFARYQEQTAEIWEQQALTRARVVAGDATLGAEVEAVIARTLARERDLPVLAAGVRKMRERIFREHGSADPWRLKHASGALVEIEFIAQLLILANAHAHPGLLTQRTVLALERAGDLGLIEADAAAALVAALRLHHALQAVLRLSTTERFEPASAPRGLARALVRAAELALRDEPPLGDLEGLQRRLVESQTAVRQIFDRLCPPTSAAKPGKETHDTRGR
jgi:glutamate-ammonia-ligase adenylyltransferase